MKLINLSKNKIISKQAKIAYSFFDRLFGLLNQNNPRFLIFNTHFGIHTFFMKTPIDVILLDKHQRVVRIEERLSPNRLFVYHPKFSLVIEMPKNTIKNCHIDINDKISIR